MVINNYFNDNMVIDPISMYLYSYSGYQVMESDVKGLCKLMFMTQLE